MPIYSCGSSILLRYSRLARDQLHSACLRHELRLNVAHVEGGEQIAMKAQRHKAKLVAKINLCDLVS